MCSLFDDEPEPPSRGEAVVIGLLVAGVLTFVLVVVACFGRLMF